jgi:hypothetical protein
VDKNSRNEGEDGEIVEEGEVEGHIETADSDNDVGNGGQQMKRICANLIGDEIAAAAVVAGIVEHGEN